MNELFPHRFSRSEEWDHEDVQDTDACGCAKGLEGWAAKEQGCRQGSYTSNTEEEACLRKKKVMIVGSGKAGAEAVEKEAEKEGHKANSTTSTDSTNSTNSTKVKKGKTYDVTEGYSVRTGKEKVTVTPDNDSKGKDRKGKDRKHEPNSATIVGSGHAVKAAVKAAAKAESRVLGSSNKTDASKDGEYKHYSKKSSQKSSPSAVAAAAAASKSGKDSWDSLIHLEQEDEYVASELSEHISQCMQVRSAGQC